MATVSEQFREAVERLAASADEQEAYVRQLGTAPSTDELALEFNDAFVVVGERLGEAAHGAALRLDQYLEEISGIENADLWTIGALYKAPEWARVRQLADDLLRCMKP